MLVVLFLLFRFFSFLWGGREKRGEGREREREITGKGRNRVKCGVFFVCFVLLRPTILIIALYSHGAVVSSPPGFLYNIYIFFLLFLFFVPALI